MSCVLRDRIFDVQYSLNNLDRVLNRLPLGANILGTFISAVQIYVYAHISFFDLLIDVGSLRLKRCVVIPIIQHQRIC
jgi:hypothetical protein